MKNLKITAPEGFEIDRDKSTFEEIVFKPIVKELPKSWEELEQIKGFKIDKRTFVTIEQGRASEALAQLSQLRKVYRGDWEPDWSDKSQVKFTIYFRESRIEINEVYYAGCFLSFQSAEVRDLFLENFRELIEKAKPLMS